MLLREESEYVMQASISFRPLGRSDFPLLQDWLSAPHMAVGWHERLDLAGVDAQYAHRLKSLARHVSKPTHCETG